MTIDEAKKAKIISENDGFNFENKEAVAVIAANAPRLTDEATVVGLRLKGGEWQDYNVPGGVLITAERFINIRNCFYVPRGTWEAAKPIFAAERERREVARRSAGYTPHHEVSMGGHHE